MAELGEKSGGHQGLAKALQKSSIDVRLYPEHLLSEPLVRKEDPTHGKRPFQKPNHLAQSLDAGGFCCSPCLFHIMCIHVTPYVFCRSCQGASFHLASDPGAEIWPVSLVCIGHSALLLTSVSHLTPPSPTAYHCLTSPYSDVSAPFPSSVFTIVTSGFPPHAPRNKSSQSSSSYPLSKI